MHFKLLKKKNRFYEFRQTRPPPFVNSIHKIPFFFNWWLPLLLISYHTLLLKQSTNAKTPKRSKNHKNTLKSQKTAWAQNGIKFIISVLVGTLDMFHTLPYYSLHYTLKKYSQLNRGRCNNVHRRVPEREICITLFKRERYNNFHEITLSLQE